MTISVIVPTYNRVDALSNCLKGLTNQRIRADEIIVVVRAEDISTLQCLSAMAISNLKMIFVDMSGQVAALNAGVKAASGSIIAITDDDTIPHPDWLEKIVKHFEQDTSIGGIGGRDIVHHRGLPVEASKTTVGKITSFGRIIGNHHIGLGEVQKVHILKGANMSFRTEALNGLRFDTNLKGTGAQVHNDMEFSLSVKSNGWNLIYDPQVCVDHFPSERFDEDKRNSFNETAVFNTAHNETYAILKHSRMINRTMYLFWVVIVGSKSSPGVLQFIRMLPSQKNVALRKVLLALKGRWDGWKTWRRSLE